MSLDVSLDVAALRRDFPVLEREFHGHRLVYLDSAATSQKPTSVIEVMDTFYRHTNANVHRGVYTLAEEATAAFESARARMARFLHASTPSEIVFTKNATEAMNLVARSWGGAHLHEGDVVVLSLMEHHANVVPWHMLAAERGIELRWIPLTDDGCLDLESLPQLLEGAALLSVTSLSNVLGTINDVRHLADAAHAADALIAVDAAQTIPHVEVDVTAWDADFVAWTGHKMLGPTGIGGLWARENLLEGMPPFLGGGEMIRDVTVDGFTTNDIPWKFEAGTPPIAEAVGLEAAIDYLDDVGLEAVRRHEIELTGYALRALHERFDDRITTYGPSDLSIRGGVISFLLDGIHAHDVSQVLDEDAVAVRAGHHCAKPLMRHLGVPATTRASFYLYNDEADADALVESLARAEKFFAV
ncbi:MAG: SufS family cysteine desulfurase [Acidimicrobiia bacterium]|nr:SufS family cysteine desulfurase [Acidimicrobiia bacterium]